MPACLGKHPPVFRDAKEEGDQYLLSWCCVDPNGKKRKKKGKILLIRRKGCSPLVYVVYITFTLHTLIPF